MPTPHTYTTTVQLLLHATPHALSSYTGTAMVTMKGEERHEQSHGRTAKYACMNTKQPPGTSINTSKNIM